VVGNKSSAVPSEIALGTTYWAILSLGSGTGEQWPPATRRRGGSSTHRQSWSLASGGSVEEPQFEFHRLAIQDGQAVVITAVAVEQALYTPG
jgi:hypothetical protein